MRLADLRLVPVSGDGVVARWAGYAVVAAGGDEEVRADLVALVRSAAAEQADAGTLAHRLAALITSTEPARLPSFAALADADDAVAVLLRGDAQLRATAGDDVLALSGRDRPTWVDDYLRGEYASVAVACGDAAPAEPGAWDLEAGVVPGGGFILVPRTEPAAAPPVRLTEAEERVPPPQEAEEEEQAVASPPVAETPAADQEPAPEVAFVTIDFGDTGDVVERAPLPVAGDATEDVVPVGTAPRPDDAPAGVLVRGLRCIRGHFNHPRARFCALCGISMVQQTQVLVEGERPPLGILVFGDGKTVGLATSYLLGRDPGIDVAVQGGELLPLQLDDPDQILSRVHCEVRLTDWDVQLVDRNSANGTYVRSEGADDWDRLAADVPVMLTPGTEARIGSHRFVYESHHQPS